MRAGSLHSSEVFENILSIGYEFETHDLAKLSLNGDNFINTDNKGSLISSGTAFEVVEKVGEHEYLINDEHLGIIVEYMDEPLDQNIMFSITNDMGTAPFGNHIKNICQDVDVDKNDLYKLQTDTGTHDIAFYGQQDNDRCYEFSGVEWIITYYNPIIGPNIIVETFFSACRIILEHLHKLTKLNATLRIEPDTIIGDTCLYHKPNTNMYYMQTQLKDDVLKPSTLAQIGVVPQMTFRCKIRHAVKIMKQIMMQPIVVKNTPLDNSSELMDEYAILEWIEFCVERLMKRQRQTNADIFGYLWLILYKLNSYINDYLKQHNDEDEENYFKNYLSFASRENNGALYRKMKNVIKSTMNLSDTAAATYILKLVNQPDIIGEFIYRNSTQRKAVTQSIDKTSAHYGDPNVSFLSYFSFFERDGTNDWLVYAEIDIFTNIGATFDDDSLLIENRWFFDEMRTYLRLEQGVRVGNPMLISELARMRKKLMVGDKIINGGGCKTRRIRKLSHTKRKK